MNEQISTSYSHRQIFVDKDNKIYLTLTEDNKIELAVQANGQSVIVKLRDESTLHHFIQKLKILEPNLASDVQV
jgi:hypothetical protein